MEEDFLLMDNILTDDEAAALFAPVDDTKKETPSQGGGEKNEEPVENNNDTTEVEEDVNPFEEEATSKPESVGSEENNEGEEDTTSNKDGGTPSNNFYSSIASALKEEGIFPDLEDEDIDKVIAPEDFRDLVQRQIEASLNETQKRIYDALQNNVEPNIIRLYENTLSYLDSITEEAINAEDENGENLRRRLLQLDFLNRGYSQERAIRMTEKLFASGEDIEEAKLALIGNKEYFLDKYEGVLKEAKAEEDKRKKALEKLAEQLKNDILSKDKVFGDIAVDKATRQKIYDNISKPVYKNKETGEYYTALLKYRMENENEYLKNVGLLYTLTDGFKDLNKLIQPSVKKEIKSKLKELEHTLNNTSRGSGTFQYVGSSGGNKKNKNFLDLGYILDIK